MSILRAGTYAHLCRGINRKHTNGNVYLAHAIGTLLNRLCADPISVLTRVNMPLNASSSDKKARLVVTAEGMEQKQLGNGTEAPCVRMVRCD